MRVLNHLGIEPIVLADERCCGHDLLWEGDIEKFRKLAELNVALLRETDAQRIVTTCPECAARHSRTCMSLGSIWVGRPRPLTRRASGSILKPFGKH